MPVLQAGGRRFESCPRNNMKEKIIISCTSYGDRLDNLRHVFTSILSNSMKPDKIVLNLANGEVLPEKLSDFIDKNSDKIIANRVEDTFVWKKFLPTFELFPDDVIICIDDDFVYPCEMIEDFVETYEANPSKPISGNRVTLYGLQCHCGCASLVKKEFFDGIDITPEMRANCHSSDFAYTWLLAQKGIFYQRTKNLYFYNMTELRHNGAWTDRANVKNSIANTLRWLEANCEVKLDVRNRKDTKVYYNVPWNSDKNIGVAYNDFASLVPDDAWVCFMDADTIPTTAFYGKIVEDIISDNPNVRAFTCVTNRIGCPWQIAEGSDWTNDDMKYHRDFGQKQYEKYGTKVVDVTITNHPMSGLFMCIHKSVWNKMGGAATNGMLGIDQDIHRRIQKAGFKVYLAKGLYMYHWYRGGDKLDKSHLLKE